MSLKYFGTDGIRGHYGKSPISESFAEKFAKGLIRYLSHTKETKVIVIGRDTRASGTNLAKAFTDIFLKYGCNVIDLGVIPTPQVSFAVTQNQASLGLAITASHNPAEDNGFKLFNASGTKFSPEQEVEIETAIDSCEEIMHTEAKGALTVMGEATTSDYFNRLNEHFSGLDLKGLKIAIDTANGATVRTSPAYLQSLGADIIQIAKNPTGGNINDNVGSEHPKSILNELEKNRCDIGIAHDGDGDRVILIDSDGEILEGELFMAIISKYHPKNQATKKHPLITTIQSNLALDLYLKTFEAGTIRTPVGDRNVFYEMQKQNSNFGGENSGHYVFSDVLPTGDGLIGALKLLEVIQFTGKSIKELKNELVLFPSQCVNLKIEKKQPLETLSNVMDCQNDVTQQLGEKGRVLLRYSGTENKLRVLVECESTELLEKLIEKLIFSVKQDLNVLN